MYCCIWVYGSPDYKNFNENLIYPIRKVYKYYPWEEMALEYTKAWYLLKKNEDYNDDGFDFTSSEDLIDESIRWMEIINLTDKNRQIKLLYKLLIWENPAILLELESDTFRYINISIELYYLRKQYE